MSRFRLSARATTDLADIHAFIANDKPIAAARFVDSFFDLFALIAKNPEIGQQRPDLRPRLRAITHGDYVVLYYPMSAGDGVEIVGVVHGARDIESMFGSRER